MTHNPVAVIFKPSALCRLVPLRCALSHHAWLCVCRAWLCVCCAWLCVGPLRLPPHCNRTHTAPPLRCLCRCCLRRYLRLCCLCHCLRLYCLRLWWTSLPLSLSPRLAALMLRSLVPFFPAKLVF
ncbi:hypothetical protein VNO80_03269 [Phaseolus coccineus]|uniref:Uncharacterized protein n=1 Tax=Phaseolus coccineus TaxID=3886 RepID=A0AAN9NRD8_PHACN